MIQRTRSFRIPTLVLLITVLALALGELASGTGLYWIAMMAITLSCIGITYNMLGGLSRISGFLFAAMASATIVISQFAKVILFEPADRNIQAPHQTITVYALYYFCLMVGVFLFGWIRLKLPKPLEPSSLTESRSLYFVSLTVGIIASAIFWIDEFGTLEEKATLAHSFGLVFSYLILFSLVLAVDSRIRETEGRHSLGLWVIVSAVAADFFQYLNTSRQGMATPVVVYLVSCYVRGYRLKKRHYAGAVLCGIAFQFLISPFALYARPLMQNLTFRNRLAKGYELITSPPGWQTLWNAQSKTQTRATFDEYYDAPGTYVLSRFSLVRADSDLIAACSHGYHYGFKAMKMDILRNIPRFLYPDKPDRGSGYYMAGIVGVGGEAEIDSFWDYTEISDSFGAFGWWGVIVFPLLVVPALFIVYESMFDMGRPWGTVALGLGVLSVWGVPMIGILNVLIKDPAAILCLSWLAVGLSRILVSPAERAGVSGRRRLGSPRAASLN